MNSCLYHGVLRHRRLQPKTHEFRYSVFMAWLDLDELPLLADVGVRRNRFAAAAFYDRDYPLGTPLKVTGYGFHRAHVLIDGKKHSIGNDYSRTLPLNVFIQRYVIPTNPQEKLTQFPPHIQTAIRNSKITKGMTREQVIMSVGYPVASENPTLDANLWRFWLGSFSEYRVRFDANGLVDRIEADVDIEHKVIQP